MSSQIKNLNQAIPQHFAAKDFTDKNAARVGAFGDVWTFIALDADTKLIPSFIVGKRDGYHAKMFMDDLASRLAMRVLGGPDAGPFGQHGNHGHFLFGFQDVCHSCFNC